MICRILCSLGNCVEQNRPSTLHIVEQKKPTNVLQPASALTHIIADSHNRVIAKQPVLLRRDLKAQLSHASVDTDPQSRRLLNYID
jgi:hypothetical protein